VRRRRNKFNRAAQAFLELPMPKMVDVDEVARV
jgi:hypothetical protein